MGIHVIDPDKVLVVVKAIKDTIQELEAVASCYNRDPFEAEVNLGNDCACFEDLVDRLKEALRVIEDKD